MRDNWACHNNDNGATGDAQRAGGEMPQKRQLPTKARGALGGNSGAAWAECTYDSVPIAMLWSPPRASTNFPAFAILLVSAATFSLLEQTGEGERGG